MANDFAMTNNTTNNRWDLTYTVDASGTKTKTLNTGGTFVDKNIQVAVTTPAGSATVAGGALTTTANYSGTPTVSVSLDSQSTSGITITDTAQTSGYYVKLTGASTSLSGTTTAKRDAITLARTAGYVTAQSKTTVSGLDETTTSPTVTVNAANKTRYLVLPTATFATSGASVYASAGGWVPKGSTSSVLATIGNGALSVAGGGLTASTGYGSLANNGYYNGSTYDTNDKIDITSQTSAASGYYKITASGYGKVTRAAVTKQITTAGYFAKDSSAVQQIASATGTSNTGTTEYFIKKSTLSASTITPSTSSQTVTIGQGYYPSDRTVTINAMSTGTVTPAINNTNLSTYFNSGSSSSYSITLQPTYTNTAGYIAAHTGTQGNGTTAYYSIKTTTRTAGDGSVTLTAGAGNVTLSVGAGDSANSSATSMSMATSTPASGVYYTLTATGKGTVTGTGKGTVSTGTGWITSGSTTSKDSASASKDSNTATTYGYITKSVHGNAISGALPSSLTRTEGTYQDIEIQPKGYLLIPAGYNPLDRYVFANVADVAGEAKASSNYSLDVSSISGSSAVSVGTKSENNYPIIANNLSVTATLTAGTAGWFSSGSATDSDTDNVTVGTMPAAVIAGSSTNATATTTVAPGTVSIAADTTSVANKTRLALSPTTATTGISTYYVAVKATAAANSTGTTSTISGSGSATVTTAGYAPTSLTGSVSVSGTATAKTSAKDSDVYYIPITTGVAAANTASVAKVATDGSNAGVNITASIGTSTTTEPTSGYYAAFTGTGSSKVTTAGWFPTGALAAATSATTYFPITSAVLGSEGSVTTAPSVAVTNSTTMATTTTNTGYSFTVGGTASNGTVQTKYKATTAGYTSTKSATNGGTVTVTPGVTGGKTVYIQKAVGSVAVSGGGSSLTGATNVTLSTSNTSGISITPTRAAISATAKITTAGYSATNDSFASGSSAAANGTTQYITGVKLVAPSSGTRSFIITVPNGNTTDFIDFVFTVDASGNVTVAGPD